MARIPVPSKVIRGFQYVLENDFTGGLKTEFTGLNFPENACTSTENCTFFHTGAVFRRNGFDYELNSKTTNINRAEAAISTFIWTNAGGDGLTKIYVNQVGGTLYFYQFTNATILNPLSSTKLAATITLSDFTAQGGTFSSSLECQYAAGNGYLFVFHPNLDPFYCTFSSGIIAGTVISIKIRDVVGIPDNFSDTFRPNSTGNTNEHNYNLLNQGWSNSTSWTTSSNTTNQVQTGPLAFTVSSGLAVSIGDIALIQATDGTGRSMSGPVSSYGGTTLTVNINTVSGAQTPPCSSWNISKGNQGLISGFFNASSTYPSNSDIWWILKDSSGVYDPATTLVNTTLNSAPAPKGYFILNAFNQQRSSSSGIPITSISTTVRPRTGTWFQGRVWYAGVDASFTPTGDAPFTTWTENIYFSQIVDKVDAFQRCYQTNDPTSDTFFDILPSDGGVITIQGSGSIYKLIPLTNGLLVHAANGIWFITGSTGIGFTATDYTITKLAAIKNVSSTSYVDVLGYPMFWNEEGIYQVGLSTEQQGISVNSMTLNTIKQFYDAIPLQSKKFSRGSYNPITGQVQWLYRSSNETDVTSRYQFDSVLTFSMFTQAFYTWNIPSGGPNIHDVTYVEGPGGSTSPFPLFKYLTSNLVSGNYMFTFAEERDNVNWKDWHSTGTPIDYTSFFVTGYRLHGDGQRKWQPGYVYIYSDNSMPTAYMINGKWDYAISGDSGLYSVPQLINNNLSPAYFAKAYKRVKIRGRGTVLQLQISSVSGKPFHIDGWSIWETQNAGV